MLCRNCRVKGDAVPPEPEWWSDIVVCQQREAVQENEPPSWYTVKWDAAQAAELRASNPC